MAAAAMAAPPVNIVYRVDGRSLAAIRHSGGMWPWARGALDNDLTHHFEGQSVAGRNSNFVSTSASLRQVVEFAASQARPNSESPFDTEFVAYLYQIRPAANFFSVSEALQTAHNSSTGARRDRLGRLIRDYPGMQEFAARGGFRDDRIIAYARLDGQMLRDYYYAPNYPLFSDEFWRRRWMSNAAYDRGFDSDASSRLIYPIVGVPSGHMHLVENGTQAPVPLSFTCFGVNPQPHSSYYNSLAQPDACQSNQYLEIRREFYDRRALLPIIKGGLEKYDYEP
ncbi:enterotoxin A family protein [Chromobacterium sp. ATCC 53434]|uniref:enterotoxin A family protein n=1 Tax=Chromobacterium sp. (strain ATCC 53434 / SC 14030) TaxID=2059672 RepID=UPI0013052828|nr:enterotoxin A family protein [Chromobacterium sp. ATCC 53434]